MHLSFEIALLLLQITASLGGVVRIDGHRPADRTCRVELFHLGMRVADQWVAATGNFRFDRIAPGPYLVDVHCTGLPEATSQIHVLGNTGVEDVSLNLRKPAEVPNKDFVRAQVYFRQQRWEDAITAGTRALRGNYRDADIHLLLAKCYANLGDAAATGTELQMFVKQAPNGRARTDARAVLELLSSKQ